MSSFDAYGDFAVTIDQIQKRTPLVRAFEAGGAGQPRRTFALRGAGDRRCASRVDGAQRAVRAPCWAAFALGRRMNVESPPDAKAKLNDDLRRLLANIQTDAMKPKA